MSATTRTTTRLLEGLFDSADDETWREFDERYRPIIVGFARRIGVGEEDAADIAQDTLARFVAAYRGRKYDRTKGRLRSWLIGIAKYRIADHWKAKARQPQLHRDSTLARLPQDEAMDDLWQAERRLVILRRALEALPALTKTREKTVQAFEMLSLHGRTAPDVAAALDMSLDDVYQAKNRVAARLGQIVDELERAYDESEAG